MPIVIDHASADPAYRGHITSKLYAIESYVSVPSVLPEGEYFGNLCAIDPKPAKVSGPAIVAMFVQFADLIARQLHNERKSQLEHRQGEWRATERRVGWAKRHHLVGGLPRLNTGLQAAG